MNTALSASVRRRALWGTCLVAVAGLLGYAYYAQYRLYLDPCPLCITQRAFYIGIGLASLLGLASVARRSWQRASALLLTLAALGGIVTAGRQVWLQHLPPEKVPECGPGLQYWLENMPALQTLSLLFKGDGNCAKVDWTFLGFSMGEWSLAWFVLFLGVGLAVLARPGARKSAAGAGGAAPAAGVQA